MARAEETIRGPMLTTRRIEALSDGIFAFAMTLLVINLALPDVETVREFGLAHVLLSQTHKFINYAVSFVVLAGFWSVHHQQFHIIEKTDNVHLWINVVGLMFVALVPFTTDVMGDWPGETTADLLFSGNILVLGVLSVVNWVYASRGRRLLDREASMERIRIGTRRSLVGPVVAAVAMVVALFAPGFSNWAYLAIPVTLALPWFRYNNPS